MTNLIKFSKENIFNYFDFVLATLFFNFNNRFVGFKNILINY